MVLNCISYQLSWAHLIRPHWVTSPIERSSWVFVAMNRMQSWMNHEAMLPCLIKWRGGGAREWRKSHHDAHTMMGPLIGMCNTWVNCEFMNRCCSSMWQAMYAPMLAFFASSQSMACMTIWYYYNITCVLIKMFHVFSPFLFNLSCCMASSLSSSPGPCSMRMCYDDAKPCPQVEITHNTSALHWCCIKHH